MFLSVETSRTLEELYHKLNILVIVKVLTKHNKSSIVGWTNTCVLLLNISILLSHPFVQLFDTPNKIN